MLCNTWTKPLCNLFSILLLCKKTVQYFVKKVQYWQCWQHQNFTAQFCIYCSILWTILERLGLQTWSWSQPQAGRRRRRVTSHESIVTVSQSHESEADSSAARDSRPRLSCRPPSLPVPRPGPCPDQQFRRGPRKGCRRRPFVRIACTALSSCRQNVDIVLGPLRRRGGSWAAWSHNLQCFRGYTDHLLAVRVASVIARVLGLEKLGTRERYCCISNFLAFFWLLPVESGTQSAACVARSWKFQPFWEFEYMCDHELQSSAFCAMNSRELLFLLELEIVMYEVIGAYVISWIDQRKEPVKTLPVHLSDFYQHFVIKKLVGA